MASASRHYQQTLIGPPSEKHSDLSRSSSPRDISKEWRAPLPGRPAGSDDADDADDAFTPRNLFAEYRSSSDGQAKQSGDEDTMSEGMRWDDIAHAPTDQKDASTPRRLQTNFSANGHLDLLSINIADEEDRESSGLIAVRAMSPPSTLWMGPDSGANSFNVGDSTLNPQVPGDHFDTVKWPPWTAINPLFSPVTPFQSRNQLVRELDRLVTRLEDEVREISDMLDACEPEAPAHLYSELAEMLNAALINLVLMDGRGDRVD